jgi:hypothetical protein
MKKILFAALLIATGALASNFALSNPSFTQILPASGLRMFPTTTGSGFWMIDRVGMVAWRCYEWNERGYIECQRLEMKLK